MDKVYVIGRDAVPQYLRLEAGGRLGLTFIALPGTVARLALEVEIAGPGCDVDIAGAYVCGGEDEYLDYLLGRVRELARTAGRTDKLEGMRVLLDCGGGAASWGRRGRGGRRNSRSGARGNATRWN